MMNKQLKIWKNDFLRYYEKTSFLMRVVIGAILSTILVLVAVNKILKPQNSKVAEVVKKLQGMEVQSDYEITIVDLKNKERRAKLQLEALQRENEKLASETGGMTKADVGKSMLELRALLDLNELKIVSEAPLIKATAIKRVSRRGTKAIDTTVKVLLPPSLAHDSFTFEVLGNFKQIQRFLIDVHNSTASFFINNIKITNSKEVITDKDFNQYFALSCYFQAHIPYQK